MIAMVIIISTTTMLAIPGLKLIKKHQFEEDVEYLKSQLQLAYDFVLHCDVPIQMELKIENNKLTSQFYCPNQLVAKMLPLKHTYKTAAQIKVDHKKVKKALFSFSFFSDMLKDETLTIIDPSSKRSFSLIIKGFPYVVEIK